MANLLDAAISKLKGLGSKAFKTKEKIRKSDEWEALKQTTPSKIAVQSMENVGNFGAKTEDIWKNAEKEGAPKLLTVPGRMFGKAIQMPTTDLLRASEEIGTRVGSGEVSEEAGAVELGTTIGMSAVLPLVMPVVLPMATGFQTLLEETNTEETFNKGVEALTGVFAKGVQTFFPNLSDGDAQSIANSTLNATRMWAGLRGGAIQNNALKGGPKIVKGNKIVPTKLNRVGQYVKGGTVQTIPDFTSLLAGYFEEALEKGKDVTGQEPIVPEDASKLKTAVVAGAFSLVPLPSMFKQRAKAFYKGLPDKQSGRVKSTLSKKINGKTREALTSERVDNGFNPVKEGGKYKLYNSKNGESNIITKAEFDYATFLKKIEVQPEAPKIKKDKTKETQGFKEEQKLRKNVKKDTAKEKKQLTERLEDLEYELKSPEVDAEIIAIKTRLGEIDSIPAKNQMGLVDIVKDQKNLGVEPKKGLADIIMEKYATTEEGKKTIAKNEEGKQKTIAKQEAYDKDVKSRFETFEDTNKVRNDKYLRTENGIIIENTKRNISNLRDGEITKINVEYGTPEIKVGDNLVNLGDFAAAFGVNIGHIMLTDLKNRKVLTDGYKNKGEKVPSAPSVRDIEISDKVMKEQYGNEIFYWIVHKGDIIDFANKADALDYIKKVNSGEIKEVINGDTTVSSERYKQFITKPITETVYHGTKDWVEGGIKIADDAPNTRGGRPAGFWTTKNKSEAKTFTEGGKTPKVIEAIITYKNPFIQGKTKPTPEMVADYNTLFDKKNGGNRDSYYTEKSNSFKDGDVGSRLSDLGLTPKEITDFYIKHGFDSYKDGANHTAVFDISKVTLPEGSTKTDLTQTVKKGLDEGFSKTDIADINAGKNILGEATNGKYTVYITNKKLSPFENKYGEQSDRYKIYVKDLDTGEMVREMNWMGWKEDSFKMSEAEWKKLPLTERAKLEAEYKVENFYKTDEKFVKYRGDEVFIPEKNTSLVKRDADGNIKEDVSQIIDDTKAEIGKDGSVFGDFLNVKKLEEFLNKGVPENYILEFTKGRYGEDSFQYRTVADYINNRPKPFDKQPTQQTIDGADIAGKTDGGSTEPPILGGYDKNFYGDLKVHLNVVARGFRKTGYVEKLFTSIYEDIAGILKPVILKTADGITRTLNDVNNEIIETSGRIKKNVIETLHVKQMVDEVEANKAAVDTAYQFVIKEGDKIFTPTGKNTEAQNLMRQTRLDGMDDARNNNSVFENNVGLKKENTSKAGVVFDYVGFEAEVIMRNMKKAKSDNKGSADSTTTKSSTDLVKTSTELSTNKKKTYEQLSEAEQAKVDKVQLTPEEIRSAYTEAVSKLPESSRPFVLDFMNKYGKWADGVVQKGLNKIGQEMLDAGLIKYLEDAYYRGYISLNKLNKYKKRAENLKEAKGKKELNDKSFLEDLNILMRESDIPKPEQLSSILKHKEVVWFLHSYDPITTALNYANETATLMRNKMLDDALNVISKSDETGNVRKYLDDVLSREKNKVKRDLFGLNQDEGIVSKVAEPFFTLTALGAYTGSNTLFFQNMLFGITVAGFKAGVNSIVGKASLGKTFKDFGDTFNYFYNNGNLARFDTDIDIKGKGAATKGKLATSVAHKIGVEKALRWSTAPFIAQMQTILGSMYMQSVVKKAGGLKKGETLSQGFERALDGMNKQEAAKKRGELRDGMIEIENTTGSAKGVGRATDQKAWNMVKTWGRNTFSKIRHSAALLADESWEGYKALKERQKNGTPNEKALLQRMDDSGVLREMSTLTANTVGAYLVISTIAKIFFDTIEEQQEFLEEMYAKNIAHHMEKLAINPIGPHGIGMSADKISTLFIDLIGGVIVAEEGQKVGTFVDGALKFFSGVKKTLGSQEGDINTDTKGRLKFENKEYSGRFAWLVGLSKEKAGYQQSVNRLLEEAQDVTGDNAFADEYSNLNRYLKNLGRKFIDYDTRLKDIKYKSKVENMVDRIHSKADTPMDFESWVMNAIGDKDYGRGSGILVENLKEKYAKDYISNRSIVKNLEYILPEINAVKGVTIYPEDFGKTLEELRVKIPKLHNKFMKSLYGSVIGEGLDSSGKESQAAYLDNLIAIENDGVRLNTSLSNMVKIAVKSAVDNFQDTKNVTADDYTKLRILDETLELVSPTPELISQIEDSLSQLVPEGINKSNIGLVYQAVEDFPNLRKLYEKAAELRGATTEIPKGEDKIPTPIDDGDERGDYGYLPDVDVPDKDKVEFGDLLQLATRKIPNVNPIVNPIREGRLLDVINKR